MPAVHGVAPERSALRPLVGDLGQVLGIRLLTLGDGPERGVRILDARTGGGLGFSVLVDRCLDLGTLELRGTPLAWQSPNGFRRADLGDAEAEGFRGFERSFGGLLVTCGLDHVRQPKDGQPLHGRLPYTPAKLLAYGVDWDAAEPTLFCEGEVVQARLGGECLRLRRRIEAPLGGNTISIQDSVTNEAPEPWPQAMLYHINFGFPAVAPGSEVSFMGAPILGPLDLPRAEAPQVLCRPVPPGRSQGHAKLQTPLPGRAGGSLRVDLTFASDSLPWFQTWLDPRPGTMALGLEPCTSERLTDGTSGPERLLAPGETRRYAWRLTVEQAA